MCSMQSCIIMQTHSNNVGNDISYCRVPIGTRLAQCEVGTVGKISDCQPEGPGFNPWPGRGLNFGRPSFAHIVHGQGR